MKNSVVYIKSAINHSFGSGFVIHQDEEGCFILTCQHVVDEVGTPLVENQTVEVIATSSNTIDMAVLYVNELKLEPLPLQIDNCNSADVEVIGFSQFTKSLNQKEYIHATLFENPIELLSKDSGFSYNARKIKAKEGFDFERGNSGSPVICKSSGKVIAMLSNKEGSNVGYAIEISNLTEVWSGLPSNLLKKQIPINYLSKLIEIVKVKKGIVVALLTLIAIYLLSPYVLTIKKLHSIEEEIIRLHGESNQTIQDKAPKYAEELTVKIKDKYLFSIAYKIAKYQDILNSYTLAASVETDKKQQILLSQKAIDAWEITTKFIQQAKSENNRWVLEENVEEDSNLMVATAMAIEAKASGDIEKTRNKFLELNIEHWYNRYIKRNEKEREPNIEWFLKNHSNQKEMQ